MSNKPKSEGPTPFFDPTWKREWQDMPEFIQEEVEPYQMIIVRFTCKEDVDEFARRIDQKITPNTKYTWFPKQREKKASEKIYVDADDQKGEKR